MSEMVERVARALWDAQYPTGTSWDDWAEQAKRNPEGFDGRDASRKLARAAIEAMREPDDEQLIEAQRAMFAATKSAPPSSAIATGYTAMITAALGKGGE